jgi:hypothetical protein
LRKKEVQKKLALTSKSPILQYGLGEQRLQISGVGFL